MERFVWKRHKDIFKGIGIYHITFVVSGRQRLLGELAIDHEEPRCLPSDLGKAISHDLEEIQQYRPYVRLLAKQLMPDHIHVLLYVTEDRGISIKEIARSMRQGWRQMAATVNIDAQMASAEGYQQTLRAKAEARHWNYQPIPVSSDRYRMMAANEIVKILCQ